MKKQVIFATIFVYSVLSLNVSWALNYYPSALLDKIANEKISNQELRSSIQKLISENQKTLTYNEARKIMFGELFLEKTASGYSIREVYCNKDIDESAGVGPGKIPNPEVVNCEHTWPQSKFSKKHSAEMQKTDLHHLYPSDMHANSTRNNFPFAEVKGKFTADDCRDSKIGNSLEGNIKSFEPPREHRGNVARAMAYFSVRYEMPIDAIQKKYFAKWNSEDPVDNEERIRHDKIMAIQGNRNPFIDYPELINRL